MLKSDLKGKNSKLIHGALNKTQFREQSESLFLTSGFVYQTLNKQKQFLKVMKQGFSILGMPTQQSIRLKKGWQ